MSFSISELNASYAIPDQLVFESGQGGLTRATLTTDACRGQFYLHGGHVTDWTPAGHEPVLFMSDASYFEAGQPIRGGVPVCFPWFGPHKTDADAPAHGLARLNPWNVVETASADAGLVVVLAADIDLYRVEQRITFGQQLTQALTVTLTHPSVSSATFEEALHTYLHVGDINLAQVKGLENTAYYDKMKEGTRQPGSTGSIWFVEELDRVYLNTPSDCTLVDPVLKRSITLSKQHADATVVWNPWIDKAKTMPDFGDNQWPGMCCLETANVADHAVTLEQGQSHTMTATLTVNPH